MKRLISLILALTILFSLFCAAPAGAASTPEEALGEVNIYSGGYPMAYLDVNGRVQKQEYTYFLDEDADTGEIKEIPAYCVNPNQYGVPQTVGKGESIRYLAAEKASDPKVVGLVANMYPHRGLPELKLDNLHQAFYAGKIALWCYLIPEWDIAKVTVNPSLTGSERAIGEKILAAAVDIYTRGMAWTSVPEPQLTTAPDRETAYPVTIGGREYYQQVFTVTSNTWVCNYEVAVRFQNPEDVPAGARITDLEDKDVAVVRVEPNGGTYNGRFKVLYPAESVEGETGSVQFSLSAEVYKYAVYYALCQEKDEYGNLQSYLCDTDPQTELVRTAVSRFRSDEPEPDEPETGLEICKYEAGTDLPLAGAAFEVKSPAGDVIGVYTTGPDGKVTIPLVAVGNYTVREAAPPAYHLLDGESTKTVTVKYGEIAQVSFHNAPYGDLRIEKIDGDSGGGLAGARVQIRHIESGATYTQETGLGGAAQFTQLKPGAYEIMELSAPQGWQRDEQTYTVAVISGECVTFTLKNSALPGLRIVKYDSQTHMTMSGVTFELFRDAVSLGRFETDALGEINLVDQQPGTYRVVEVDTGDASHIIAPPQEIELTAGVGIRTLYFFNDTKPGMWLVKVDGADPSKAIPNAVFTVRAIDGSYGPKEFTTDRNGEIDLSALPVGAYEVMERSCPGYIIDEARRIIHLEPNQTARFVFTNSVRPSLHLVKLSADGAPLPGVTFRIAAIADGSHYLDRTTNAQGEILIADLEPGVYSVKETSTVADHLIDPAEHHVELFPGQTSTIVLNNDRRPNLTIHKSDADTGAPVAGAVFTVKAADGSTVTEVKTGQDGTATLKNLLPIVYEVTEKSVPAPYLLDAPSQLITLYPNRDSDLYFENHKKPNLTVNKLDSITGEPIQGAKFQIWYGSNSTATGELNDLGFFHTDEHGRFTINALRDGWYKITEVEPAHGYAIQNPATQEVFIRGGESKTVTFENVPLSALVVWKYDAVTGEAVAGAVFQVKYLGGASGTGGTVIGTHKTSANGSFTVTGLREGTYIVEELASDSGHVIDAAPQTAYISGEAQDVVQLYFGNSPKGALLIKKVDGVTREPLSDVEFMVTTGDGTVVGSANGKFVTDSAGTILIENIDPGVTLVVKETRAREGYLLDDASQTAKIKSGGTVTLEFCNQPTSSLLIVKKDAVTGEPLADVEFLVTDSGGGVLGSANGKFVTDSAGTIRIDGLTPGMTVIAKETRAKAGYLLDDAPQSAKIKSNETVTLEFRNQPLGGLIIHKLDSVTKKPLEGVQFKITYADGSFVPDQGGKLSSNGLYRTDKNGQITLSGITGTLVVTEVESIPGYTIDETGRSQTVVVNPDDTQTLTFYNDPVGGVELLKVNEADKSERIPNTTFEIRRMDGGLVDTVTTGKNGRVFVTLEDGAYYAVEVEAAEGFKLDSTPHYFKVRDGKCPTVTVTNRAFSGILIRKVDSTTGKGVPNVTFLLYDSGHNPVEQFTTDQRGYAYVDTLDISGRVYLRELEAPGYVVDEDLKTVYVRPGETTEIKWENTPLQGQIQILKTSADYNSRNGWAAGTPLPGAVFELFDRANNLVDTIQTDKNGLAVSKLLPLGCYTVKESVAPAFYEVNGTPMEAEIESSGQIVRLAMADRSLYTNVSITKRGYAEVVPGQTVRYDFTGIGNNSTVALESFFWRDTLPAQSVRLDKIVTGTYNAAGSYKVVYRTNLSGESWRTLADNLSTGRNSVLDASPAALGLASNEYVTEFMFSFGVVPANFRQVEAPQVYATVYAWLTGGSQFVNQADVGGVYNGQWIMATSRWVTRVYKPTDPLPRTGY